MTKFYSASTGGFYSPDIHPFMPPDAVEIADTQWQELLQQQSKGLRITAGPGGAPVAVSPGQGGGPPSENG